MRDLNYQLKQLCYRNLDGSFNTPAARERFLTLIANQLREMGYRRMNAHSLKTKNVEALTQRWLHEDLATGTIKNRMNSLRWFVAKAGRRHAVARSNEYYGIPDRKRVGHPSKKLRAWIRKRSPGPRILTCA